MTDESAVPLVLLIGAAEEVALNLQTELRDEVETARATVEDLLTLTAEASRGSRPVLVVVGDELPAPAGLVHSLRPDGVDVTVVVVSAPGAEGGTAMLPLLFSADQVRRLPAGSSDRLGDVVRNVLESMARRRAYTASLDAAQRQLADGAVIVRQVGDRVFGRFLAEAPIGAVVVDDAETLTGWNHRAAAILHLTDPASLGLPLHTLFPARVHDDLHAFLSSRDAAEATFTRTVGAETEQVLRLATQQVMDANGAERTLVLAEDVTASVHAQRRLAERTKHALLTADVAAAMTAPGELPEHLRRCAQAIAGHLDAACVHIWTVGPRGTQLTAAAEAGECPRLDDAQHAHEPPGPVIAEIAAQQRPHLDNPQQDHTDSARERSTGFAGYPLIFGGQLMGVLLVTTAQHLSQDALTTLAGVADQVAVGIRQDLLLRRLRSTAEALQRPLLPPRLPELPGFDLAARYHPFGHDDQIGGDFYDAYTTPDGRHVLVLGDVCGKGPKAAAVTGLVRHTLWTAAQHSTEPDHVLSLVNQALLRQNSPFCTLVYAVLDTSDRPTRLRIACAGHPLPLLRHGDGRITQLPVGGPVLGVLGEVRHEVMEVPLHPGDTLVLYTDGFTEGAGGYRQRESQDLAAVLDTFRLRTGADHPADEIAEALLTDARQWWGERLRDDMALLTLTALPVTHGDQTDHQREFALDTDLPPLTEVRTWTREFLADLDEDVVGDAELIVTELLTNAYEHAVGPRALRLHRSSAEPVVRIEVDDATPHGLLQPGTSSLSPFRGRGLLLIDTISTRWGVENHRSHKTVWADIPAGAAPADVEPAGGSAR
ncbi:SpoIIE family protein phosphatase [Saccharothrix isguenensis]